MVVYLVTFASIPFGGIPGDLRTYLISMVYLATFMSTPFRGIPGDFYVYPFLV